MRIVQTGISDLVIVEPTVFKDERGYFFEAHSAEKFEKLGIEPGVMQINQSASTAGVLRGLHYQKPPHDQSKLVRCLRGALFDVAVDIRHGSPTFGKWFGVELTAENKKMLFVPSGFAHGFYAMSDCEMLYLCGKSGYHKSSEGGLCFDDPSIGIEWPFLDTHPIVNERDRSFPDLSSLDEEPVFFYTEENEEKV